MADMRREAVMRGNINSLTARQNDRGHLARVRSVLALAKVVGSSDTEWHV